MVIKNIKGFSPKILGGKKDFHKCQAGIRTHRVLLNICVVNFLAFIMGYFDSLMIAEPIVSLIEKQPLEIGTIIISLLFLVLLTPISIIFVSLLFTYNFSFAPLNTYVIIFSNLMGGVIMLTQAYRTPILIFIVNSCLLAISFIVSQQVFNKQYWRLIKDWSVYCGTIGGTSFYGMDLSDAIFDYADLRNTDLRETNLTGASFVGAKNLELALVKGTILEDIRVRNLLVNPRSWEEKNFTGANFQGANLRDANLRGANLTLVNAIDADFTGANFDDVCIQDWNISKNTKFRGVQCRRVYLKQNKQEPKPDSGEFQEGEFEKWVTEIQDTVDLIFRKGLSLRSLAFAIAQVSIDNEETQLTVESIAHKGDDFVVVKVGKQGNATKEKIHAALTNEYHQAQQAISTGHDLILRAKDDQIEQMRSYIHAQEKHIQGLISCIAQPREPMIVTKIYSTQQGDIMEGQKIQAGGNIEQGNRIISGGDFTSTGSTTNLGEMEIGGQVTNSIQQLQDIQTSDSQELAQILTALQTAIQDEQNLPPAIKTVSLENVKILSEEAKKEPAQRSKSILEKAVDFLSGIGKIVGDTSKLAEVCKTHLPTLTKLLGF
jgi:uncharacterized protein YjbI with pentapeptide repeats